MEHSPSKRPFRPIFILITFIALLLLFILGWFPHFRQEEKNEALADNAQLPEVILQTAVPSDKGNELILPSSAVAFHVTPLWARTNGYLINYLVDIGDLVKQGQLLAEIDTPEVDQQLQQAEADLASAKAKRDIAKITAERWKFLYQENQEAIPLQDVDERMATLTSTEADVLSAEKNVARLKDIQKFQKIYAPFDGIITKRDIDIGSLINSGGTATPQELFRIAQIDTIRFFVDVPQNFFRQIKDGLPAKVSIKEFPGIAFDGHVARYAKALDPTARTLRTEVDVDNKDGKILPGLYAEVKFSMEENEPRFIVPARALIVRTDGPKIAIVKDDLVAHLVPVTIGHDFGNTMEIIYGLHTGDRIIVNPTEKIKEGVHVQILKDSKT